MKMKGAGEAQKQAKQTNKQTPVGIKIKARQNNKTDAKQ